MAFQAVGSCVTAQVPSILSSSGILETSEPIDTVAYWTSTVTGLIRVSLWTGMPVTAAGQSGEVHLTSTNPSGENGRVITTGLIADNSTTSTGLFNMTVGDVLYLSILLNPGQTFASVLQYAITIEAL